jgi:hypothetical protein
MLVEVGRPRCRFVQDHRPADVGLVLSFRKTGHHQFKPPETAGPDPATYEEAQ